MGVLRARVGGTWVDILGGTAAGGAAIGWTYKYNSTTTAPPGAGEVRFNAAGDRMWLSYTDVNGRAFKPRGMMAQRSDVFYLYDPTIPTAWQCYQLALVPEDVGTYMEMVTLVNVDGGGSVFTNGNNLILEHVTANSEVKVGTTAGANTDLWYDTGAQGYDLAAAVVPGNAIGVVAVGSFTFGDGVALSSGAALTNALVYTPQAGRRYRLRCGLRAINNAGNTYGSMQLYDNGVANTDRYIQIIGGVGYNHCETEFHINGDGASHSYVINWNGSAGSVGYSSGGYYYLEDIGPISTPAPPVTAYGAWNQVTLVGGWTWNTGGGFPSYRKVGDMVQLRGTMFNSGANTMRTTAFTLPVGFRPATNTDMAFMGANWIPCNLSISTAGVVTPQCNSTQDAQQPQNWVPLAGMNFSTVL